MPKHHAKPKWENDEKILFFVGNHLFFQHSLSQQYSDQQAAHFRQVEKKQKK